MTLKYEVEKLDDIDEPLRALYKEEGGKFRLTVDGIPKNDSGELSERLRKLEENNRALLTEKKNAKEAAEKAALDAAKKGGDIEALEKSWAEKLNSTVSAKDQELQSLNSIINSLTVQATATTLAADVFGKHADVMMPHIINRLSVEITDGKPTIRVMDQAGKPSALSVDDLKKELSGRFADFAVGAKSTGGGQPGKGQSGPVPSITRSAFEAMQAGEKARRGAEIGAGKLRLVDG